MASAHCVQLQRTQGVKTALLLIKALSQIIKYLLYVLLHYIRTRCVPFGNDKFHLAPAFLNISFIFSVSAQSKAVFPSSFLASISAPVFEEIGDAIGGIVGRIKSKTVFGVNISSVPY